MSEDTRYNGWRNYETWNAALWLDNDGRGEYWRERAGEIFADQDHERDDTARQLAEELENEADEFRPDVSGMYADLLGAAMGQIDWLEIAEHYVSDIPDAEDEEDAA